MPRRKAKAEAELLPSEDKNHPRVVEAKHTIEFKAPHTIEEPGELIEEEATELDDDLVFEDRPKKKRQSYREELRKKLRAQGVSPATRLTITIEKYVHSESVESGMWADREFCTKSFCEESYVLDEGYMDLLKQWGPGTYRITLRLNGSIVDAFDKRVAAPPRVAPVVSPTDPNSPPFMIQSNGDGQQAMPSIKDIMKGQREALKEHLEMTKLMREAYGLQSEAPGQQQQQSTDPEVLLLQNLAGNDKFMEKVNSGLIKKLFGDSAPDDEPSWSAIGMEAVKSGQLAGAIDAAFRGLASLVNMIIPRSNNNGQAPIHQTPIQNQTQPGDQQQGRLVSGQEVGQVDTAPSAVGNVAGDVQTNNVSQRITPEQHALSRLIENCQRNVPVKVAFQQLISYADAVEDQAPAYSIYGYVDLLGSMPTDQVIEFVKSLPNGEQVVSLPHAREWTAELQRLIKESQEGEEE